MYSKFQLAKKYLHYYLTASNGNGHGIHSPFVFDFIKNVLNDSRNFYAYQQIENLREQLLKDETIIEVEDFGAGSAIFQNNKRTVAEIVKHCGQIRKIGKTIIQDSKLLPAKNGDRIRNVGRIIFYLSCICSCWSEIDNHRRFTCNSCDCKKKFSVS